MADDILGHEHLEHGKHLHKGKKTHTHDPNNSKLGSTHGHHGSHVVPSGGLHVGLRTTKKIVPHDSHGHAHGDHEHKNDSNTTRTNWRPWLIGACIVLPFAFGLYRISPALALTLGILALNAIIEYHKWFTSGMPLDFEILYIGSAYLTVSQSLGWGMCIALIGPFVASFARAHVCEEEFIKAFALVITALAASVLGRQTGAFYIAIVFGIIVQTLGTTFFSGQDATLNILSRLSTLALHSYLVFFVVSGFLVG